VDHLLVHYFQIIILGIVEGVTEFLPISSTGHLLIAEALGLGHEPDVFNVVIQAGAILAVLFIYWNKIYALATHLDNPVARIYVAKVALAFVVTCLLLVVFIIHFKLRLPESLVPVAWATLVGGLVIYLIEFFAKHLYAHDDISWLEAALMGAAQVIAAAFPGSSRSGCTIMTGLACGIKRPAATEFSFLLGIPTMFAASAVDLFRYRKQLIGGDHQLITDIVLGFIVSMVVAFFVVKWLIRFVQSHTFNGFATYRVILGIVLLVALATHALPDVGLKPPEAAEKAVEKAAEPEAAATMSAPAVNAVTNTAGQTVQTPATPIPTMAPASAPTTNTDTTSSAPAPTPVTNAPVTNAPAQ
jgi:undecaprenyl-diphosphatase